MILNGRSVTGRYWVLACFLSACVGPISTPSRLQTGAWVSVSHPQDPIVLRIPSYLMARNEHGCFSGRNSAEGVVGSVLDFCIDVVPTSEVDGLPPFPVAAGPEPNCAWDCWIYEDVETRNTVLGRHPAIVQTALVSGGLTGQHQVPTVLARLQLDLEWVAFLRGDAPNPSDVDVLLQIAATVELQ